MPEPSETALDAPPRGVPNARASGIAWAARRVVLAGEVDLAGFRRAARALLSEDVPPVSVEWQPSTQDDGLFAGAAATVEATDTSGANPVEAASARGAPGVKVPAAFVELCASVVLHADPSRFALLYRLLWRLVHEPALRHDPLDADRITLDRMAKAVRRDQHKMTAFVRFRRIEQDAGEPLHVAWFEPQHHIVEATAPFFARRFAQMRWAILTPERSVRWTGGQLQLGPGASRDEAPPADAGEALWLTYYEHIFNPARLKTKMMQKEMPRRYWPNLPEAVLIDPLTAASQERSMRMIEQGPTEPAHRSAAPAAPKPIAVPIEQPVHVTTLSALNEATQRCRACPIGAMATQAVPGEGPPLEPRLMLVGEQPGDQEDLRGRPFVGPAGQLLDRALAQLGWSRDELYVTNAVKHFKYELRGKRRLHKTPAQREADICSQWLENEIELVRPKAAVALGATAARALMKRPVAVMSERGRWQTRPDGLKVLVTLHPSALLRGDPADRDSAFARWIEDLAAATES